MMKPRLHIHLFHKKIHSFHFFGIIGFIIGTLLGVLLCYYLQLRIDIILLMGLTGAAVFFLLAIGAKLITGEETIVYYHHEIAILITCAIVLRSLHLPVLSYLDIVILGIATFLAFGRIGCFSVGCCHGKPTKKGVIYGHDHVESGFTSYYEGVPLFPVQLVESAFVFIIIITGSYLVFHAAPGTVLILYTVVYGTFRFIIEFFRGDPERGYYHGLSEAQWTTLILVALSFILSFTGLVPIYNWHFITAIAVFGIAVYAIYKNNIDNRIFRPRHIRQIAAALNEFFKDDPLASGSRTLEIPVQMFQTDLGLNLSGGESIEQDILIKHYTISCKNSHQLTYPIAQKLAIIIQQLQKHHQSFEITETKTSVFHILFKEKMGSSSYSQEKRYTFIGI